MKEKTTLFSMHMTQEEKEAFKRVAKDANTNMSGYLRQHIMQKDKKLKQLEAKS